METFQIERRIDAPRAQAWEVLSDLDSWGGHAPNLSRTEVIEGAAEGAVRRCYNNSGKGWSETCTLWQPGQRYTMEVDTSDYPYPMRQMRGTWAVENDPGGTRIHLRYEFEPKYGLAGRALAVLMRPVFARTCRKMLDSYEQALRLRAQPAA